MATEPVHADLNFTDPKVSPEDATPKRETQFNGHAWKWSKRHGCWVRPLTEDERAIVLPSGEE